jgi:hypothetical protein
MYSVILRLPPEFTIGRGTVSVRMRLRYCRLAPTSTGVGDDSTTLLVATTTTVEVAR